MGYNKALFLWKYQRGVFRLTKTEKRQLIKFTTIAVAIQPTKKDIMMGIISCIFSQIARMSHSLSNTAKVILERRLIGNHDLSRWIERKKEVIPNCGFHIRVGCPFYGKRPTNLDDESIWGFIFYPKRSYWIYLQTAFVLFAWRNYSSNIICHSFDKSNILFNRNLKTLLICQLL